MGNSLHMVNIDIKLIPSILCPFKLQGIVDKFIDTACMYMYVNSIISLAWYN